MHSKHIVVLIVAVLLSAIISSLSAGYLGFKVGPIYDKNRQCCETPHFANLFLSLKEALGLVTFNSQMDQDRWIVQRVFPSVKNGYFVDIGSADGVLASNTKVLEDLGWSGICIDPFPKNMRSRTCAVFKEVVDSKAGRKVPFRAAGIWGGIEQYLDKWKELDVVKQAEVVEFTTTTLDDILARAKAPDFIHYISLDIEGAELEALKAFPFSKYKVGAFTIEHNFEEPKRSQIKDLLESKGYRRVRTVAQDDYYTIYPILRIGETITFSNPTNGENNYLLDGWSSPEEFGVWSDGNKAAIGFRLQFKERKAGDLLLTIEGQAFVSPKHPHVAIEVFANGSKLGGWPLSFGVKVGELVTRVPRALVPEDGNVTITFIIKDPVSPKELGLSDDYRRLGLALRKMSLGWAGNDTPQRFGSNQ
jgi:Methyltransferase FkbM domain